MGTGGRLNSVHTHSARCLRPRSQRSSYLQVKTDKPLPARSSLQVTLDCHPQGHAHGPRPRPRSHSRVSGYRGLGSGALLRITRPGLNSLFPPWPPLRNRLAILASRSDLRVPASSRAPRTYEPHPPPRISRLRLRTPAWAGAPRSPRGGALATQLPKLPALGTVCVNVRALPEWTTFLTG